MQWCDITPTPLTSDPHLASLIYMILSGIRGGKEERPLFNPSGHFPLQKGTGFHKPCVGEKDYLKKQETFTGQDVHWEEAMACLTASLGAGGEGTRSVG